MHVEFNIIGLSLSGQVYVKPEAPVYRIGHPDNWQEGEPAQVKIESLECDGKDALFLLDSDLGDAIETAAYLAAKRQS